jgi:hypothetical protein
MRSLENAIREDRKGNLVELIGLRLWKRNLFFQPLV